MGIGRKLLMLCIVLIVGAAALESATSVALFRYYAHKGSELYPHGTSTGFLIRKCIGDIFHIHPPVSFSSDNSDLFISDPVLGYTLNPGVYHLVEKSQNGSHAFKVTIQKDGSRATSAHNNADSPRIYLMGNSWMWGYGIDDEMTIGWLLQSHLPEFQVLNLAVTGYSNVQNLLQYRAIEDQLTQNDIVVLSYYGALDEHYNVGDKIGVFGHHFERALNKISDFEKLRLPFGYLSPAGDLGIRYLSIDCATHLAACSPGPDMNVDGTRVAAAIFGEILNQRRCHIVVASFPGLDENDGVIAMSRASGATVADLQFPKSALDANDYIPSHSHRGAFATHALFENLLQTLRVSGLVPN
jgi:hypothetical protein